MDDNIYNQPGLYNLEHAGSSRDIGFFTRLATIYRPRRILEIGCGNGRVTLPVAEAAATWGGSVSGLDNSAAMLEAARQSPWGPRVDWIEGDLRTFRAPEPFDLIISPCASLSHLLTLDDQLTAWSAAFANLSPGGRFTVAELMPDLPVLADSMSCPPRVALQLDGDVTAETPGPDESERLLRYRTVRYHAHSQHMHVHYLYDHFPAGDQEAQRHLSDYRAHVFFPNELQLLFRATGFVIDSVAGDYRGEPLTHTSRTLLVTGQRQASG